MEERVIIRSEVSNVIKRISRTILIIGWAISILIGGTVLPNRYCSGWNRCFFCVCG